MYRFKHAGAVWAAIDKVSRLKASKFIAIAYITDTSHLHLSENDIVVLDASNRAVASGQTSKEALKEMARVAHVYSYEGLHAKVIACGDTLIIGSMNASLASQQVLEEAALIVDHPAAVQDAKNWVLALAKKAQPVTEDFLKRIDRIKVKRRLGRSGVIRRKRQIRSRNKEQWFYFTAAPLKDQKKIDQYDTTAVDVKERFLDQIKDRFVDWIRLSKKSPITMRVTENDRLIVAYKPHNQSKRRYVMPYGRVVEIDDEAEEKYRLVYYSVPENADERSLPWGKFEHHARLYGLPIRHNTHGRELKNTGSAEQLVEAWPI